MIIPERLLHVFHWPAAYQIRLLLPLMLIVSLLLHVAGLYFLRATPVPVRGALPPLPAKVTLWPDAASSVLLQARDPAWIEREADGAALGAEMTVGAPSRALHPVLPELVPAPEEIREETWVPALPPLAVQPLIAGTVRPVVPELTGVTARFDRAGPEITGEVMGRLRSAAPQAPPAAATELFVSLDPAGQVRHVWLVRGSGDPALDAAAMRAVQRSRFGPQSEGYEGILRIVWAPGGGATP